ncbi:MAG: MlaD family protein [Actinomycetota bacterium]|nr:MCE family protein [Actinomycetota bacterium]
MRFNRTHLALGLTALIAVTGGLGLIGQKLSSKQTNGYPVTVTFERAGQLLKPGGDVKLRGILVGKIKSIRVKPERTAEITLAMFKGQAVPANVTATIRGKTLFGEKFIALTDGPSGEGLLASGADISEDRSTGPFELEQVLRTTLPILDEVNPGDLGEALRTLAEGFSGQEAAGRRSIENGITTLQALNDQSANLTRVLSGLPASSGALAKAAPDLITTLRNLDTFNQAVLTKQDPARAVLKDLPSWLDEVGKIIQRHQRDLADISVKGADILDVVSNHRAELPRTITGLKDFTQSWDTNLSIGCKDAAGRTIGQVHAELKDSTCWQIWQVTAESMKSPGGYNTTGPKPTPGFTSASAGVFNAQVRQMLALPFGHEPTGLELLIYGALRDSNGLIPETQL